MKGSKVTTQKQFFLLLEELTKRPEMAKGTPLFGCNRKSLQGEWDDLRVKLNSLGPPLRTTAEWKKVWADLRSRTKKKLADNALERRRTGGGPLCLSVLTPLEEEVDKILSLSRNVESPGVLFGVGTKRMREETTNVNYPNPILVTSDGVVEVPDYEEVECDDPPTVQMVNQPLTGTSQQRPAAKQRRNNDEEIVELLRQQNKVQEKGFADISAMLQRMGNALEALVAENSRLQVAQSLLEL